MAEDERDLRRRAEAVGAVMYERDRAARALGITVEEIGPGFACCRMAVRVDMANGHGTTHGGFVFTLADTAFAYACNSYDRATVALSAQITFVAPARPGDVLMATAREMSRGGRTGIYDVEVVKESGSSIAFFRGHSYETGGPVVSAGGSEATRARPGR
jgi:acyl-CoA thioesterase